MFFVVKLSVGMGGFCGILTNLGTQGKQAMDNNPFFLEKQWWQESPSRFFLRLQIRNAIFAWLEHLVTPWGNMRSNGPTEWRSTVDWDVVACECLLVPYWLRRLQRILSGTKWFLKLLTFQVIKGRPFQRSRNEACTYHDSITNSQMARSCPWWQSCIHIWAWDSKIWGVACFEGFRGISAGIWPGPIHVQPRWHPSGHSCKGPFLMEGLRVWMS